MQTLYFIYPLTNQCAFNGMQSGDNVHSENKGKQTKKKLCSENNKSVAANDTAPSAISINVIRNRCTWVWARNSTFFCSCSRNLFFVHKQTLKRLTYNLISAFLCSSAATHWCLATHTHILDAFMLRLSAVAVHEERKKKSRRIYCPQSFNINCNER